MVYGMSVGESWNLSLQDKRLSCIEARIVQSAQPNYRPGFPRDRDIRKIENCTTQSTLEH
jgi:hypothetical protein